MSSAVRLAFLYPHLLRASTRAQPQHWMASASSHAALAAANARRSSHALRRAKSSFAPRHGKAVAPETWRPPVEDDTADKDDAGAAGAAEGNATEDVAVGSDQLAEADSVATKQDAEPTTKKAQTATDERGAAPDVILAAAPQTPPSPAVAETTKKDSESSNSSSSRATETGDKEQSQTTTTDDSAELSTAAAAAETKAAKAKAAEARAAKAKAAQTKEAAKSSGPLEAVLHMQPPEHIAQQHPSMSPPPYEHHFDSYSLVKQLEDGGYTPHQSVTAMKAIRQLLAKNLNVAQQSLVSKSDVENETYLFSAACSELNTEVKNNRRIAEEELRQQRTHLQHEVDILTQSLNQEIATLNDTVKGMYNDRKQAVREEQKAMDSAIQKISYKISIDLTSDAKTEIEGVRWVLIWRSVLGIIFMAFLTLGTLRLATYEKQRKQEIERVRKEEEGKRRAEEARQRREEEKQRRREEEKRRKVEEDARKEEERRRRESEAAQRQEEEEELRRYGPRNGTSKNDSNDPAGKAVDDVESLSAN